jgi:tRNA pseudouridine38-40 synthase
MTRRIALGIEYDGTGFMGWQAQAHGPSLQRTIEDAVGFVANAPVEAVCAGRTDAGVHARCQVVHVDVAVERSERAWVLGCNSRLPREVALRWVRPVANDFHARYAAIARRYRYTILNRSVRPALDARFVCWERVPLDLDAMRAGAAALLGEHDFSAFRTVACQARYPVRTIESLEIHARDERVEIEIQANAFLHHMVRNIVGALLPVGRGDEPPQWIGDLLAARDRARGGPTAPAQGLCFLGPLFARRWGLPGEVSTDREREPRREPAHATEGADDE